MAEDASPPQANSQDPSTEAFRAALHLHGQGKIAEAEAAYRALLQRWPHHGQAWHHLGILALQRNDYAMAAELIGKVLPNADTVAAPWANYGIAMLRLGKVDEAIAAQQRAVRIDPTFVAAYKNLGNAYREKNMRDEAEAAYRQALCIAPDADGWFNLGLALQNVDPGGGIAAFRQAAALDPNHVKALSSLANLLRLQGRIEDARVVWDRAISIDPQPGLRFMRALTVNPIVAGRAEIEAERQRQSAAIAALEADTPPLLAPEDEVFTANFFMAYHGRNNRDVHTRIGRLYEKACPGLAWQAPHVARPRDPQLGTPERRIRVGFLSQFLRRHSIGKTTRGILAQLDKSRFESAAIFVQPAIDDDIARFIREAADHSLVLPKKLPAARAAVAALELDILFFQDIGMEPYTYFLAFSRLAPVQCVSFGHPDTTGIPNMDWFISNDLFELPEAASHYSEKLFQLHDLGTLAYYYRPEDPNPRKSRAELPLPQQGRVYLCPQHLFKIHPDFDDIAIDILRRDPEGHLVLIAQGPQTWSDLTLRRMGRTGTDVMNRVSVIPPQEGPDFLSLLAAADVVLDTVHFNGMNTSLEALSQGAVVVTLPSDQQRGRHTQGMYRKMGILEPVAKDAADYVAIALRVAQDAEYRADLRRRILAANHLLYEDPRVVREFERFFLASLGLES